MKAAGRLYEPVTYEGADHGFMRLGDGYFIINRANKAARDQAFARLVTLWRERRERAKLARNSAHWIASLTPLFALNTGFGNCCRRQGCAQSQRNGYRVVRTWSLCERLRHGEESCDGISGS